MRIDPAHESRPGLEHLEPRLLLSAPTATLDVDDVLQGGDRAHSFVVQYTSDEPIDVDSLDGLDLLITGPGGYSQNGRFMAIVDTGDPLSIRAIYRVEAPGGRWDALDNGTYDIALRADQVANTLDEFNAAAALGSFNVDAGDPGLGEESLGDLGTLAGLTLLTNLNNVLTTPLQFEFRMTGTGTADHFIQLDYANDDSSINYSLYRKANGKLVRVKDAAKKTSAADNVQDSTSRRVSLKNVPAGTYVIQFTGLNPHFSLAINPALAPTPDLAAVTLTTGNLPDTLVPGDTFKAKVMMTNIGDGKLLGSVVVDLYLSTDQTFDDADVLLGTNAVRTVVAPFGYTRVFPNENKTSLTTGKSKTVTITATVPSNITAGSYFIIARTDATDLIPEVTEANNTIASAAAIDVAFKFGTFDDRRGAILRYRDPNGTNVILRLSGSGFGELTFTGGVASLVLRGTTAQSRVTITTSGGTREWSIDDVTVGDPLDLGDSTSIGSIVATTTNVLGTVEATGTIGSARFKNLTLP